MINKDKENNVIAAEFPEIKPVKDVHTQMVLCEFPDIRKDSENPMFKKDGKPLKYASIGAILSAIKPELNKHGMYPTSFETLENPGFLTIRIMHGESKTYIETYVKLLDLSSMQKYGGSKTYALKRGICELCGVSADENDDNDGNGLENTITKTYVSPKPEPMPTLQEPIALTENERGALTYELYNLWVKKEGSVRASETVRSKSVVARFEAETVDQLPDDKLIDMKVYLNGFQDVIYG